MNSRGLPGVTNRASPQVGTIRVKDAQDNDVPRDVLFAFAYHAFWPD